MKSNPDSAKSWPDYRAVWRWHFYAGLFTMPFVIVLSISGSIYLFKPQIEAWNDREYDNLDVSAETATVADQVQAALASIPGSTPKGYELPRTPRAASHVILNKTGESMRVYVHPESLQVLGTVAENQQFTRWLFRLHGELLMGNRGSNLVELAASWTIIMILSGLYLWWPRQMKGLAGVVYPRLRVGSRIFWRDIHGVTGVWISALALFLLVTGLPWAKFWGGYLKEIRRLTGTAVAQQDWTSGNEETAGNKQRARVASDDSGHDGHGGGQRRGQTSAGAGRRRASAPMPKDISAFDRVANTVRPLNLEHPVVIGPPTSADSEEWTAKSMTQNRRHRVNLVINGTSGEIISRDDFGDRHWVDRMVGTGIAAHEGQLFGWPNQALGVLTATGLVLLSFSGCIMWWRRREQGVLGAPKVTLSARVSWGLIVIVVILGAYVPLFGLSLLVVLLAEFAVLKRIPRIREWLGLHVPCKAD